jgi:hypothetical protein
LGAEIDEYSKSHCMQVIVFIEVERISELYRALKGESWHTVEMMAEKTQRHKQEIALHYVDWDRLTNLYMIPSDDEET